MDKPIKAIPQSLQKIINRYPRFVKNSFVEPASATPGDIMNEPIKSPEVLADVIISEFDYNTDALAEGHLLKTDMRVKENIDIFNQPLLAMGCKDGCNVVSDDVTIGKVQKQWNPIGVGYDITQCYSALVKQQGYFMTGAGAGIGNLLTSPEFTRFWAAFSIRFTFAEIWRKVYFDKEVGILPTDFTPQPVDLGWKLPTEDYFNCITGIWAQLLNEPAIYRSVIAANSGATYALQALAPGAADAILLDLIENAPVVLTGNPSTKIYVTRSLYFALYRDATSTTNFTGGRYTPAVQNGGSTYMTKAQYAGYELVVRDDWDYAIRNFYDNGTRFFNPHRAIMTTEDNIAVGFDGKSLEDIFGTPSYSEWHDSVFQKIRTLLDAKVLEEKKIAYAY